MAPALSDEGVEFGETEALSLLNTAFLIAGEALTAPGLRPEERLATLMECHGDALAALGPNARLPFSEFRAKLRGPIRDMLPSWISTEGLEDLTILDSDGYVTEDAFDLRWENAELLNLIRNLRDFSGGRVSADQVRNHLAQKEVFEAISGRGPEQYVHDRTNLITHPAGDTDELSDLGLPLKAVGFYTDISYQSLYRDWWFPCPVCRWPMKVTEYRSGGKNYGKAECFYPRHAETGASYYFHLTEGGPPTLQPFGDVIRPITREVPLHLGVPGEPPQARSANGCKALARGVWRYTTVPGLAELRLHQELESRLARTGAQVGLWPMGDAYDHLVKVTKPDGTVRKFKADLKDYTHAHTLGKTIHRAQGDRGRAQWLVVPDHRAGQVPLLDAICVKYEMRALTATDFAVMVCAEAGAEWA
ncbi:hypothetical protein Ssi03_77210 [Sphaerisporangium siamense]|uniref:REase associating with pPIWI RE domain-containing protein n=1 Tax=Sphaerisporangium siamense TaxID=795645 RepID=A0A7W7D8S9_9ACTN|nr:hypothetical protein [Sphaerisporangium siamense]MBB4702342.1 hypothetical protein [Sphaerisporangium siamense]GII89731.1 hypothetical protein Ssi03_77210 [Sphaerisporangium siamense]